MLLPHLIVCFLKKSQICNISMGYISLFHVFSYGVHKNQILRVKDELYYMHILLDDTFCSMGQSGVANGIL